MEIHKLLKKYLLDPVKGVIKVTSALAALGLSTTAPAAIHPLEVCPLSSILENAKLSVTSGMNLTSDNSSDIALDTSNPSAITGVGYWGDPYDTTTTTTTTIASLFDGTAQSTAAGVIPSTAAYWEALYNAVIDSSSPTTTTTTTRYMVHVLAHNEDQPALKIKVYSIDVEDKTNKLSNQILLTSSTTFDSTGISTALVVNASNAADRNVALNLTHALGMSMDLSLRKMIQLEKNKLLSKPKAIHSIFVVVDETPDHADGLTQKGTLAALTTALQTAVTALEPLWMTVPPTGTTGTPTNLMDLAVLNGMTRQEFLSLGMPTTATAKLHYHAGFLASNAKSHIYEDPLGTALMVSDGTNPPVLFSIDLLSKEHSTDFVNQLFTVSNAINTSVSPSVFDGSGIAVSSNTYDGTEIDNLIASLSGAFQNANTNSFNSTSALTADPYTYKYFDCSTGSFTNAEDALNAIKLSKISDIDISGGMHKALFGTAPTSSSVELVQKCEAVLKDGTVTNFASAQFGALATFSTDLNTNLQYFPFVSLSLLNVLKENGKVMMHNRDVNGSYWGAADFKADATNHAVNASASTNLTFNLLEGVEAYGPIAGAINHAIENGNNSAYQVGSVFPLAGKSGAALTFQAPGTPAAPATPPAITHTYNNGDVVFLGKGGLSGTVVWNGTQFTDGTNLIVGASTSAITGSASSYGCYTLTQDITTSETYTIASAEIVITSLPTTNAYTATSKVDITKTYTAYGYFGGSNNITLVENSNAIELTSIDLTAVKGPTDYYALELFGTGFKIANKTTHRLFGPSASSSTATSVDKIIPDLMAAFKGTLPTTLTATPTATGFDVTGGSVTLTSVVIKAAGAAPNTILDTYTLTATTGANNYNVALKPPTTFTAAVGNFIEIKNLTSSLIDGNYLIVAGSVDTSGNVDKYAILDSTYATVASVAASDILSSSTSATGTYAVTAVAASGLPVLSLQKVVAPNHPLANQFYNLGKAGLTGTVTHDTARNELNATGLSAVSLVGLTGTLPTAGSSYGWYQLTATGLKDEYTLVDKSVAFTLDPTKVYMSTTTIANGSYDIYAHLDAATSNKFDLIDTSGTTTVQLEAKDLTSLGPLVDYYDITSASTASSFTITKKTTASNHPLIPTGSTSVDQQITGLLASGLYTGPTTVLTIDASGNVTAIGTTTLTPSLTSTAIPAGSVSIDDVTLTDRPNPGEYTATLKATDVMSTSPQYFDATTGSLTPGIQYVVLTDGTNNYAFPVNSGSIDYKNSIPVTAKTAGSLTATCMTVSISTATDIDGYKVCDVAATYPLTAGDYEVTNLHTVAGFTNGAPLAVTEPTPGNFQVLGQAIGATSGTFNYQTYEFAIDPAQPGQYIVKNKAPEYTLSLGNWVLKDTAGVLATLPTGNYIVLESSPASTGATGAAGQYVFAQVASGTLGTFYGPYEITVAPASAISYWTSFAAAASKVNGFTTYALDQKNTHPLITSLTGTYDAYNTSGTAIPDTLYIKIGGLMASGTDFSKAQTITIGAGSYTIDGKNYTFAPTTRTSSAPGDLVWDDFAITPAAKSGDYMITPIAGQYTTSLTKVPVAYTGTGPTVGTQYAIFNESWTSSRDLNTKFVPYSSSALDFKNAIDVTIINTGSGSTTPTATLDFTKSSTSVTFGGITVDIYNWKTSGIASGEYTIPNLLTAEYFISGATYTVTTDISGNITEVKDSSGKILPITGLAKTTTGTPATINDFGFAYIGTGNEYTISTKLSIYTTTASAVQINTSTTGVSGLPLSGDYVVLNDGTNLYAMPVADFTTAKTGKSYVTVPSAATGPVTTGYKSTDTIHNYNIADVPGSNPQAYTFTRIVHEFGNGGNYDIDPAIYQNPAFISGSSYVVKPGTSGTPDKVTVGGNDYDLNARTSSYKDFTVAPNLTTSNMYNVTPKVTALTFTGNQDITARGSIVAAGTYAILPIGATYDIVPHNGISLDWKQVISGATVGTGGAYSIMLNGTDGKTGLPLYTVAVASSGGGSAAPVPVIPVTQHVLQAGDYDITGLSSGLTGVYTLDKIGLQTFQVKDSAGAVMGIATIKVAAPAGANPSVADRYNLVPVTGTTDQYTITKVTFTTSPATPFIANKANPLPGQAVTPPSTTIPVSELKPDILISITQDGVTTNMDGKSPQEVSALWAAAVKKYESQTGRKKPFIYETYSIKNQKSSAYSYTGQKNIKF